MFCRIEIFINHRNYKIVTKMKSKTHENLHFVLAALMLFGIFILSASLASAANELIFNQTSYSLSLNHATSGAISFFLNNTLSNQNITNISFSSSVLTTGSYTISSGNVSLPSNITNIQYNSTSSVLSATIAVPSYQQPGTYAGTITASGTNGTSLTAQLSISLTVNSTSSLSLTSPAELNRAQNNSSFTITNTGNVDFTSINLSYDAASIRDSAGRQATLAFSSNLFDLSKGASRTINITSDIPSNLYLEDYTTTITANSSSGTTATTSLKVVSDYCKYGKNGTSVEILSLQDKSSETDWDWKPLDSVDIEVSVRNNGIDEEDITVQIGLYDPQDKEFVDLDKDEKTVSVGDGRSKDVEFTINVPVDIKDRNYRLYVRAFYDSDERGQCTDRIGSEFYRAINIDKESREMTLQSINIPEYVNCGESVDITAKAYNIGTRDEDKVYLSIYNKELGISQNSNSFLLDEGDSEVVTFSISVPKNSTEQNYTLTFKAYYDYDEDDDSYDLTSTFTEQLKVSGQCTASVSRDVSISASLAEGYENAIAGSTMKLKVTLTNPKDTETTYSISASGYEDWAKLDRVEPSTLTLEKGESGSAYLYFKIDGDASGEKIFKAKITYDSQVKEQSLAVTIQKSTLSAFASSLGENITSNKAVWILVTLIVVLVVLIILVSVARAKPKVSVV